jgi:hypothetical protein
MLYQNKQIWRQMHFLALIQTCETVQSKENGKSQKGNIKINLQEIRVQESELDWSDSKQNTVSDVMKFQVP